MEWYSFISSRWNALDLFVVPAAFVLHCLSFASDSWGHIPTLVANCLLFVRLLWVSLDARFGLVLLLNIVEAVLQLSYLMAVVVYFFGTLGIELFHDYTPGVHVCMRE